jgi:predicted RNA-binding Zn ribbon-like protein
MKVIHNHRAAQDGYTSVVTSTPTVAAPGELELLRRFINTRDIEAGTDAIDNPVAAQRWLAAAGLWRGDNVAIGERELERVHRFREVLRETSMANHDGQPLPDEAVATLNDTAVWAGLTWSIDADRQWAMTPTVGGAAGAMGGLVAIMSAAMVQGTWRRLKICSSDLCRWAFYDHSRSGTGKWCSMKLCGNRAKQETWRTRNQHG